MKEEKDKTSKAVGEKTLREQIEHLMGDSGNMIMSATSTGYDNFIDQLLQLFTALEDRVREEDAKIVREHLLTDWSGEAEVDAELEQIAKKIELSKKGQNENKDS